MAMSINFSDRIYKFNEYHLWLADQNLARSLQGKHNYMDV